MLRNLYVWFVAAAFVLLPFTRAFTIDIGFPLKAYEPIFAAAVMMFLLTDARVDRADSRQFLLPLFGFCAVAVASYVSATYAGRGSAFDFRGGEEIDGALRIFYYIFDILLFLMTYKSTERGSGRLFAEAWLLGTALSAAYALYCAASLTFTDEAFLLPGLERHQISSIGPIVVSRSGTFEEGNFAGLYFLVSATLAYYFRRWGYVAVALLGLLLTKSSSGFFGFIALLGVVIVQRRGGKLLALPALGLAALAVYGLINYLTLEGKFGGGASSGSSRVNEVLTAMAMFRDHPILGMGPGQYGFRFFEYVWDPTIIPEDATLRHIPNNIYAELLSETGLLGFLCMAVFWRNWLKRVAKSAQRNGAIYAMGLGMMVVWLAYPAFSVAFMWCFMGFGLSLASPAVRRPVRPQPAAAEPHPRLAVEGRRVTRVRGH